MKAGWTTKLLQEVVIFQRGTSITKKQVTSGNIPVIAGGQKPAYFHNQKNREANSITISTSGAYAGFVSFHPYPVFASDCFTVESKPEKLNQKFLFHFLKFKQKEIYNMQSGDAQPHVYVRNFNDFEVSFPSLKEQQRIVEILDESFAELETARSNAAANLESSKELFQSVLDESLSGAEEKGWESRKIEDVCEVIPGQSPNGKYYNQEANGLPFYQGKKEFTNRVLGQPTKWTTLVTKEAVAGDIVMSVRAPVGPVNEVSERICIGRGLAAIRSSIEINKDFLWYFLLSVQNEIKGKDGAVFPSINRQEIESIELMLPPLEEQQRVVEILDSLCSQTDRLQQEYTSQLADIDELRQSFLQKAFAGKLT